MSKYEETKVWQRSNDLVAMIYQETNDYKELGQGSLGYEMRSASAAVTSRIANGLSRKNNKTQISFMESAIGALFKLETHCRTSKKLEFLSEETYEKVFEEVVVCKKMLFGFVKYLKKEEYVEN